MRRRPRHCPEELAVAEVCSGFSDSERGRVIEETGQGDGADGSEAKSGLLRRPLSPLRMGQGDAREGAGRWGSGWERGAGGERVRDRRP